MLKTLPLPFYALLLVLLSVIPSCKKDTGGETSRLLFEKADYLPFETALINSENLQIPDGEYSGTVGGTTLKLTAVDNSLVTILPDLGEGTYTLSVTVNGNSYDATFHLQGAQNITDPDAVFNSYQQTASATVQSLTQYADSLSPTAKADVLAAIQTLQQYNDSVNQQYNLLPTNEKLNCARFLSANFSWLEEVHVATNDLLAASFTFKTQDAIYDTEATVKYKMDKFVLARIKVVYGIKKAIMLASVGGAIGSVFPFLGTGVGVAVGAGIGIGLLITDLQSLSIAQDELLDYTFMQTQQLFNWKTNTFVSFQHLVYEPVNVSMNYRSLYVGDKTSSVPIVKNFVDGLQEIKTLWNSALSKISIAFTFVPKTIDNRPAFNTGTRPVHGKYLSVAGIDNSKVEFVIADITDGNYAPKFRNKDAAAQDFSFQLKYQSDLGSQTTAIDADITGNGAYTLLGNWHCDKYWFNSVNGFNIYYNSTAQCQGTNYTLHHHTETTQILMQFSSATQVYYDKRSTIYEEHINQQGCSIYTVPINNDVIENMTYALSQGQDVFTLTGNGFSLTYQFEWESANIFTITGQQGDDLVKMEFIRD